MPTAADPDALLCESCGYPIDRLPEEGNCPECGRPIARSLPSARRGSPWQQDPAVSSLIVTAFEAIRHPGPLFEGIRIEWRGGLGLLASNLLLAAVLIVAPWSGTLVGDPMRTARQRHLSPLTGAWVIPLQVAAVALVLAALTGIEWVGIQFFARRRGQRLLPEAAWQVCAHASVGWVMAAAFSLLGLIIGLNLVSKYMAASDWALAAAPAGGGLLGLLVFEILVYTGVGRCRYANRARPPAAGA